MHVYVFAGCLELSLSETPCCSVILHDGCKKNKKNKGLLTISGHQHRFKYENSSNKSKGPCTQRLKYSYAFFHIHYPTNVPSTETLHIESDASIAKQFRKQYKMESSSSEDDFLIEKRKRKRKYWVHSILRWCREDRAAG